MSALLHEHVLLVFGLIVLVVTRVYTPDVTGRGGNPEAFRRLFRRFGAVVGAAFVALWAIQTSAGPDPGPSFALWPEPQRWMALGVVALVWLVAAGWVFLGAGAKTIAEAFGTDVRGARAGAVVALLAVAAANLIPFVLPMP